MVVLESIDIVNKRRIEYKYSCDRNSQKYFNKNDPFFVEYDQDISDVPVSILVIPFLANFQPIAWFAGFDIKIKEVDQTFFNSLIELKSVFEKYFPDILVKSSNLIFSNTIDNNIEKVKDCMLFSGGVDAYATYFRNNNDDLDLVTVHGADVGLEDIQQWNDVVSYNSTEPMIANNLKYYIKCNLRTFLTFEVDRLLPNLGWWGKIQHGMALTSLVAPLASINGYQNVYIASTYTRKANYKFVVWGSMPEIDNLVRWSGTKVIHDGEKLTRQEKIVLIENETHASNLKIRVCYSDHKSDLNCSSCEKCLRTIFGLLITGADPNNYGFSVSNEVYNKILKLLKTDFAHEGSQLNWREMLEYTHDNHKFFYFANEKLENKEYFKIINLLEHLCYKKTSSISQMKKFKLEITSKFPNIFKIYLKLRRKLL